MPPSPASPALTTPRFADELTRVDAAVRYYERFSAALRAGELDPALSAYYGVRPGEPERFLRFKALFFATRIEPVVCFIERFVREHGRAPRMLDIGCGFGIETTWLAAAGAEMHGIDYYASKIETARALSARLRAIAGTDRELELSAGDILGFAASSGFDAIYTSATLHHIEPLQPACDAIARLLAPGGTFFLSEENASSPVQQLLVQRSIGWTQRRVLQLKDERTGVTRPYGNENIRRVSVWQRHFERAGLRACGTKYCRLVPPLPLETAALLRAERWLRALPVVSTLAAIGFLSVFDKPFEPSAGNT